jgi:ABC-type glycerol-3-phosphate transport system substrate-binding protein
MDNTTSQSQEKQSDIPQRGAVPVKDQVSIPPVNPKTAQNIPAKEVEEFKYQPKPKINLKKTLKVVVSVISFLIILVPLLFIFLKYNPFKNKGVSTKRGEIVWWSLGIDEVVAKKMVADYLKDNPKAKINLIVESEIDYGERLLNSLKDGKGPDVFTIHNSWVPMMAEQLDPMPANVYSQEEYSKSYYSVVSKDFKTTEGIVGIPLEYDALTLFVNEDIFSRSGKTYPKTWDEFATLADELTLKDGKGFILQSGAALGITQNVDYWQEIIALLLLENKSNLFSPNTNPTVEQTSFEALLSFADYYSTAKVWNSSLPSSTTAFADGKAVMIFAPAKAAREIKKISPNLKFRTIIVPQVRKNDPNEPDVSYATYWAQAVWRKSGDKELAWDFLKYLASDGSYEKMQSYYKELGIPPPASPKVSQREKLTNDRVLGSVVALAPIATSWYLADKTYDGPKGINTSVNAAYKKTIDAVSLTRRRDKIVLLKTLSSELKKGLFTFGITH